MRLVRFDTITVNMDQVTHIATHTGYAYLFFSAPYALNGIDSLQADYVKIEDGCYNALMIWLEDNSENPGAPFELVPNEQGEMEGTPYGQCNEPRGDGTICGHIFPLDNPDDPEYIHHCPRCSSTAIVEVKLKAAVAAAAAIASDPDDIPF